MKGVDCDYKRLFNKRAECFEAGLGKYTEPNFNKSTEEWLQTIEDRLQYQKWYFGHCHGEWKIDKVQMLFEDIEEFE